MFVAFRSGPFTAAALGLFALAGCTQSREPKLPPIHPVSGVVKYRGQPAAGWRVVFNPVSDIGEVKFAPAAVTDAVGAFKLRSYRPDDGAPQGEYAVTFVWPDHIIQETDPDPVPEVDRLRGVYNDPQQSRFKVQVLAGPNTLPPFELN